MLYIIIFLILSVVLICVSNILKLNQNNIQGISLISSIFTFFFLIFFWIFFDRTTCEYQFIYKHNYLDLSNNFFINKYLISFGIDGISFFFLLLSAFIIPLCLLTSYKQHFIHIKDYCLYLLVLEIFLLLAFSAVDLILFFFFFESILIPMFFIIGIWGSRERRVRAAFFFFYTLYLVQFFYYFQY